MVFWCFVSLFRCFAVSLFSNVQIEQNNCLIIQHIDDKAQFSRFIEKKNGKTTIFLRDPQNYVYCRISVACARRILSAL